MFQQKRNLGQSTKKERITKEKTNYKVITPDRGGSSFYEDCKLIVLHNWPASLNI